MKFFVEKDITEWAEIFSLVEPNEDAAKECYQELSEEGKLDYTTIEKNIVKPLADIIARTAHELYGI